MRTIEGRWGMAETRRVDLWWVTPAAIAFGLLLFFGYLTFRAFNPTYVYHAPYISPTVAPPVFTAPDVYPGSVPADVAWFGTFPEWWPAFLPATPAFFLPAFAILFRFTCYYYRGAYYKAFVLRPPSCAVGGIKGRDYRGERSLLIFQNLHRYTLYMALVLLFFLWEEAIVAFFRDGQFGIGVGTVMMVINAALLSGYTFGCHSWRHLIGGRYDCFSCDGGRGGATTGYRLWRPSTWFNERHQLFAWCSLVWVALTDAYIYLVSSGRLQDLNTWQ